MPTVGTGGSLRRGSPIAVESAVNKEEWPRRTTRYRKCRNLPYGVRMRLKCLNARRINGHVI